MKVLSLFDWIACWYEALVRAWIKVDEYFASEIDENAIKIAKKNHEDIIEIWDVQKIRYSTPDWDNWWEYLMNENWIVWKWPFDLLIWWSPCQWFSRAWKWKNFQDERSWLFFEYVRILKEVKPKYFLLENVKMKKERQDKISELLWVEPIEINSSLVSAQNRKRLYWTNIPWIKQPEDKKIMLKDILQDNVSEKYNSKASNLIFMRGGELLVKQATKQWFIVANDWDWINLSFPNSKTRRWRIIHWKSNTLTTYWETHVILIPNQVKVRKHKVDIEWLKEELRKNKNQSNKIIAERLNQPLTKVEHRFRKDNCFAIPDPEIRFKLKELLWITTDKFDKSIIEFESKPGTFEKSERKISVQWKMTTLTTWGNDEIIDWYKIRKLTPIECERLQTLPDNYTEGISENQRYKVLWNGRTVEVIAHIFKHLI